MVGGAADLMDPTPLSAWRHPRTKISRVEDASQDVTRHLAGEPCRQSKQHDERDRRETATGTDAHRLLISFFAHCELVKFNQSSLHNTVTKSGRLGFSFHIAIFTFWLGLRYYCATLLWCLIQKKKSSNYRRLH